MTPVETKQQVRKILIANLGPTVRELRQDLGYTVGDFAKDIGVERHAIDSCEKQQGIPTMVNLAVIAMGFGMTLAELCQAVMDRIARERQKGEQS